MVLPTIAGPEGEVWQTRAAVSKRPRVDPHGPEPQVLVAHRSPGGVVAAVKHLVLSVFGFTLTLASIAGLVLNVGMAVDASVLIFERMKEEMRLGKSTQAVVKSGFERALYAIADSNITTIIAALVLTQLARGSIQGFAVTLTIGNLATLFSAVFVSRLIFDFNVEVLKVKKIWVTWSKIA